MPNRHRIWIVLSSLILLRTRTCSKKPTALLCALPPVCAPCGVIVTVPPSLKSTSLFYKEILYPLSVSHRSLSNRVIEDDLNSPTSCIFDQDLQAFSQRSNSLFRTSVLLHTSQLLSLLLAIPVFRLYCVHRRGTRNVSVTCLQHFQELLKILKIVCPFDERLSQTFVHAGPAPTRILTSAPC